MAQSFSSAETLAPGQKLSREVMPKLNIALCSRVHIRINPMSSSRPLPGEFIGLSHFDFLVLRLPTVPGLRNQLLSQTPVEVRYLTDGALNSFHTEIISHLVKPAFLLFLAYPERLTIREMRRHQRLPCALPIQIFSSHGDAKGIISDLSMGGCRICLGLSGQADIRKLQVGDSIVLQTALGEEGAPCGGSAVVRSVEISGVKLTAGISFDGADKVFSEALSGYLSLVRALV